MTRTDSGSAVVRATQADVFAALVDVDARTIFLPPSGMSGVFEWITATDVPDGIDSADHTTAFASTLANLDAYLRECAAAGTSN